jgi:sugar phosphate isomerase/epimerase
VRLAINALEDELAPAAAACLREGVGIEVTAFAFPDRLDDGLGERIQAHREAIEGVDDVSSHGPFMDLYVTSVDPAVVDVCRRRHEQALEASLAVGATIYVAHMNSIPLIRNARYRDRFVDACVAFWTPFAEHAWENGATIVLENLWEPDPSLHVAVLDAADHPGLGASFDNGHALVFSDVAAREWIEALEEDLLHVHLHDNDGALDQHMPAGRGVEDWPALLSALQDHAPDAMVVLECDGLEPNLECLRAVRGLLRGR